MGVCVVATPPQEGHLAVVELLLRFGANIEVEAANTLTPRDYARARGHAAVAALLDACARCRAAARAGNVVYFQVGVLSERQQLP